MPSAAQICEEAAKLVGSSRHAQYGDPTINFKNIAVFWNAYIKTAGLLRGELTALDVARMLILMKLARTLVGEVNLDEWHDLAGYAGCAGAIASDVKTS